MKRLARPAVLVLALLLGLPVLAGEEGRSVIYRLEVHEPHPARAPAKERRRWWQRKPKRGTEGWALPEHPLEQRVHRWLKAKGLRVLPPDSREEAEVLVGLVTLRSLEGQEPMTRDEVQPFEGELSLRWLSRRGEIQQHAQLIRRGTREKIHEAFLELIEERFAEVVDAPGAQRWLALEIHGVGFARHSALQAALLASPEVDEVVRREATPELARWELRAYRPASEVGASLHGLSLGEDTLKVVAQGETRLVLELAARPGPPAP
ncbi:MAG: hypothetical protein P1V51_22290 [Deltaproteobacteria bacterium]|nr:hypothetical protein [Deltaproteobacteria bacterium]